MQRFMRFLSISALAGTTAVCMAPEARAGDCRQVAVEKMRGLSADGFAVYQAITDKHFFLNWVTCDDVQLGLATAVHESVHFITAHDDAFPLVNGGEIKRPHEISTFFAPSRIANKFGASDFVVTYLRPGSASSSSDFLYLLDELNAYAHDLNAAMDLNSLHAADEEVDHRDGLAAAMAFVARYAQTAQESQPATWDGLKEPAVAQTVSALWTQAEQVMTSSCGIPNFGSEDKTFIKQFCQPKAQSAMRTIIGRAPVCPTACLKETSDPSG